MVIVVSGGQEGEKKQRGSARRKIENVLALRRLEDFGNPLAGKSVVPAVGNVFVESGKGGGDFHSMQTRLKSPLEAVDFSKAIPGARYATCLARLSIPISRNFVPRNSSPGGYRWTSIKKARAPDRAEFSREDLFAHSIVR
ncbi:hypothetical protein KM043_011532 [Ampulex compressa]|nr:hypothetical protein KM043_011532 [Ampulex compressa]